MAKKKRQRALLDVLSREKDFEKDVSIWQAPPTYSGGPSHPETIRRTANSEERRGQEGFRMTYAQTVVIVLVVVCLCAASFLIGRRFGTIVLPPTEDKRTLEEIREGPPAPDIAQVKQIAPGGVEAPTRPDAEPPTPPAGATPEGRYQLRIITLPVGGQSRRFREFLAGRGIETEIERIGQRVIVFSKARFLSDSSPESQGFRKKVVELGPVYSRLTGGPTNLESCYFVKVENEGE